MSLNTLIQQREELSIRTIQYLTEHVQEIKNAGEHMSECATDMRGQGFSSFVMAREDFIRKINNLSTCLHDIIDR